MMEVICVIIGAILSILTTTIFSMIRYYNMKVKYSRLLYFDLYSIQQYFTEKFSDLSTSPDIRYNSNWQQIVINIGKISNKKLKIIYDLYDTIYAYDCTTRIGEEKLWEYYRRIEGIVHGKDFILLLDEIRKKGRLKRE